MVTTVTRHPERILGALLGAAAGEHLAGTAAGVAPLLDLCELIVAGEGHLTPGAGAEIARAAAGVGSGTALVLLAVPIGLVSPLDRPRLRQTAHRLALDGGADEGTAITAVAAAVLAADLCRFDLETALVRLRQTLLEEAPTALHARLRVLGWSEAAAGSGDPGAALQLALTALFRSDDVPGAVAQAEGFGGDIASALALTGALAGARTGLDGIDGDAAERVPGRARIAAVAAALAAVAASEAPSRHAVAQGAAAALARLTGGPPASPPPSGPASPGLSRDRP